MWDRRTQILALYFGRTVGVFNMKLLPKEEAEILLLLVALRCFA